MCWSYIRVILAKFVMNDICMDVIREINILKRGELPIYEPTLKEILDKNVQAKRLRFTAHLKETVENGM